jgi:hypothetical protein
MNDILTTLFNGITMRSPNNEDKKDSKNNTDDHLKENTSSTNINNNSNNVKENTIPTDHPMHDNSPTSYENTTFPVDWDIKLCTSVFSI